ncbi:MAG: hypothetical protein IJD79_01515 [Clostridia bacterium]|nr:hypothetical protein [Clostridia bacterium]
MNNNFKVLARNMAGEIIPLVPTVTEVGDEIRVLFKKSDLCGKACKYLRVDSALTSVPVGSDGYVIYPTNFGYGVMMTSFDKVERGEGAEFRSRTSAMPVAAICGTERAVMIHVQKMSTDARFFVRCAEGDYRISPEIVLDGDDPDEDILIVYKRMPGSTYVDVAKEYRKYQIEVMGCRPLRERAEEREQLRRAADCIELRIRMGWKPQPTPVRRQTLENEPPMKIACTVERLNKLIDAMKAAGVRGTEICLVGWGPGGHDGRFPDHYPMDERFGKDEELRAFIAKAKSYGYMVVNHSNSKGAYEIARTWDADTLTMKLNDEGKPEAWLRSDYVKNGLQGGDPWHICAKPAYEKYAVRDLPVIREYGFEGLHYVDELTACEPVKCCAPNHPITRAETVKYYRKIAKLSTELFGGFQSEAWFDFMNADTDYVLYTSVHSKADEGASPNPLFDELIPFWVLVYHGIVMSNATSGTVNYPIKDRFEQLRLVEFGSRPMLYINSKFAGRDWMGKTDLYCMTDEEIDASVAAIKHAEDEYDTMKHLQYEFIDNHEKIAEGVYRVTYSDGTVITVDYNKGEYKVV